MESIQTETPAFERVGTSPAAASGGALIMSVNDWTAFLEERTPEEQRLQLIAMLRNLLEATLTPEQLYNAVLAADLAWRPFAQGISRRYRHDVSTVSSESAPFHGQMGEIGRVFAEIYMRIAGLLLAHAGAEALSGETLRQVTARAIFHLGKCTKWLICNRVQAEARLWRRLHELFQLSVREGFDMRPMVLYQNHEAATTCSQLWLRTVMLGTLNTGNLSPRQVDRAEQWLQEWSAGIAIDRGYEESKHLYCVDLAGEAGPVRITQGQTMSHPAYLRTTKLYGDIVAARLHYFEQSMNSTIGLYAKNPLGEFLDLLDQLQRMWTSTSFHIRGRASARKEAPSGTCAEVALGIAEILQLRQRRGKRSSRAALWTVREQSERGVGLVAALDGGAVPRTRQLVALRRQDLSAWQIGVIVRVMNLQAEQSHQIGVRLLAREAIVLTLFRIADPAAGTGPVPHGSVEVFFLPGNERSGLADSLLCPAGTLTPKTRLSLATRSNEYLISINRVIEGTSDWQRIGFQVLEKHALSNPPRDSAAPVKLTSPVPESPPDGRADVRAPADPVAGYSGPGLFSNLTLQADDKRPAKARTVTKEEKDIADYIAVIKELHPRLAAAIELMWGSIECEKYMDRLILNDRDTRQGFSEPVMSALLSLYTRHTAEFKFGGEAAI